MLKFVLKKRWLKNAFGFVILTLFLGFSLRIVKPWFGFPILYTIPDEVPNYLAALQMLATKSIASYSQYPPLGSYVQIPFLVLAYFVMRLTGVVSSLKDIELLLVTHEGYFLFIPRIISAIFATLSLIVVYQLALLVFAKQKWVAFWSVVLLAFSVTHIQLSHIGKPWMGALFFTEVGMLYLIKSIYNKNKKKGNRQAILSSLCFSVAIGFHYAAGFFFILFILVRVFSRNRLRPMLKIDWITFTCLLIPVIFVLFYRSVKTGPYVQHQVEAWIWIQKNLSAGLHRPLLWYAKEFLLTDPFIVVAFVLGLYFLRQDSLRKKLLLFALIYFLIFALAFFRSVRYMLPIYAILTIFGGYGIDRVLSRLQNVTVRRVSGIGIFLFIFLPGLVWVQRYMVDPTFIDVVQWINTHIPPETRIGYLGVRFAGFTPATASIDLMQVKSPTAYGRAKKLLPKNTYSDNVREVVYLENVVNIRDKELLLRYIYEHDVHFVVYYYWHPSERYGESEMPEFRVRYRSSPFLVDRGERTRDLIHWAGTLNDIIKTYRFGPYFEVLEVVSQKSSNTVKTLN